MRHAGGNPHGALRRHDPVAVTRLHLHDARGAVQQLRAPVRVGGQQLARWIVIADGDHGAVQRVVAVDMGIAHGRDGDGGMTAEWVSNRRPDWPKQEHYCPIL
ncbi:hypothetical protein D3C71_1463040 [compost metagenome]